MTQREAILTIKKDLLYLKKAQKSSNESVNHAVILQLIQDNLRFLELEGLDACKTFGKDKRKSHKNLHPEVLLLCQDAVADNTGNLPAALEEQLHSTPCRLPYHALLWIPCILKLYLIQAIRTGVEQKDHTIMEQAIHGLHQLKDLNMEQIFRQYSYLEQVLSQDPAGVYSQMDQPTKDFYRRQCACQADELHQEESVFADNLLQTAKQNSLHIGFPLMEGSVKEKKKETWGKLELLCQWILPLIISVGVSLLLHYKWGILLFYLPFHSLIRPLLRRIFMKNQPPYFMPRMEFLQKIPQEHKTMVTVSIILPDAAKATEIASHLERLFLANNNGDVQFCLLADLPESKSEITQQDDEKIEAMTLAIQRLNEKYNNRFVLIIRPRRYCKTQNAFCGWERKRGALLELAQAMEGKPVEFKVISDPGQHLLKTKYILALDQDSQLLFNGAYELVTAAAHPFNQPKIDPNTKTVVAGYGILSPRIVHQIPNKKTTLFSLLLNRFGVSSYQSPCGDLYQDLLGKTVFSGKGLLHVKAVNQCLPDAFPSERILSHDIIEGAYLRCGLVSDVEVADGNPENAVAWNKRQHRWIRGDFQNLVWLFRNINSAKGLIKNPIDWVNRVMIADNLARSLYPPAIFSLLFLAWITPDLSWFFIGLMLVSLVLSETIALIYSFYKQGGLYFQQTSYSLLLPCRLREWLRALFQITQLAEDAKVAVSGAVKGLYRGFIRHKKCLEWATASQSSSLPSNSLLYYYRCNLFSVLAGIVLFIAPSLPLKGFGLIFLFAPFLQWITDKEKPVVSPCESNKSEREFLLETGRKMWQFYVDTCTEEENFLPPDNLQEQPVHAIAHRTSPTNIGLYLLSTICAHDLGYIDLEEMLQRLASTYGTLQLLERWNGHLLNWYDTQTMQPLFPRYCSTVDSGNYVCCLATVKNRLADIPHKTAIDLQKQMEQDLDAIQFSPLFHAHRNLFHIGYDLEQNKLSSSYYDMFMSECRMTSFYAIAKRQIPKKHWWTLNRIMTQDGHRVGPLSWTGTAFEYLMAPLLLPVFPETLSYEAIQFCIDCQIKQANGKKPWGSSESGYYAFDDFLTYQYQPNGVPQLALKQYPREELVLAPYATFLSLPYRFKQAMANLRLLKAMNATGKYGYYEAIDYTPSRCLHAKSEIIYSYMAHHVGMSICAIENCLNNQQLQKWFMQEEFLGAQSLLMEAIPDGVAIYHPSLTEKVPQKPKIAKNSYSETQEINLDSPSYSLLCNKSRRIIANSLGETESLWNNLLLYRIPQDFLGKQTGFLVGLALENRTIHLTLSPNYENNPRYRYQELDNSLLYSYKDEQLSVSMRLELSKSGTAELRTITIKNRQQKPLSGHLFFYCEPLLHTKEQVRSHPAYCKLFIDCHYNSQTNQLCFQKRNRPGGAHPCLYVGFTDSSLHYNFSCSKQTAIRYDNNQFTLHLPQGKSTACVPDPCCLISLPILVSGKSKITRQLFLSAKFDEAKAIGAGVPFSKMPVLLRERALASMLAKELLARLCGPRTNRRWLSSDCFHRTLLWKCGVSGDLPIIVCQVRSLTDLERLRHYLPAWRLLTRLGIQSDLLILYREFGDYTRKRHQQILSLVSQCNCEDRLEKQAGIHLVNIAGNPELKSAILSACAYEIKSTQQANPAATDFQPIQLTKPQKAELPHTQTNKVQGGYFNKNSFIVTKEPAIPWCHTLANSNFGTQVTNRSLGFTYAINARENRLTCWSNDPCIHYTGERLILKLEDRYYDLIDGSIPEFATDWVRYSGRVKNNSYQITVQIIDMQKKITVHFQHPLPHGTLLAYYTEPALDFDRKHANQLIETVIDDIPAVFQPMNVAFGGWMAMASSLPMTSCFDSHAFWKGDWQQSHPAHASNHCLAGIISIKQHVVYTLSYGQTQQQARIHAIPSANKPAAAKPGFYIHTNDPLLDVMVNCFLPHQVINDRLYAKTGFYQCSGAYGFRDQLQDAGNLLMMFPHLTRQQILLCCSRQFSQGDVLHWWHELPAGPAGVRTRCSDDMLWLPYTVARYVMSTGDLELLKEPVPFLIAPALDANQMERYDNGFSVSEPESVYEHCKRAIAVVKRSARGLALIGSCDWNDGFSCVGIEGKGESVWLTQFYAMVCSEFSHVALRMKDLSYATQLQELSDELKGMVETHCWDEDRYTRAYFDNGEAIGSKHGIENQLDVLPQAFAVLAQLPNHQRNRQAVFTAYHTLVDHEHQLIRLFTPPFQQQDAGYISAYPPGIRENGGQYTHGVIWLIQALLQLREPEKAYQLIQYVCPSHHSVTKQLAAEYAGEPYAMAGDVYTHPDAMGKAGWTHYTGAAGWLYRIIWEDMFGIQQQNEKLIIQPNLPAALYNAKCKITIQQTVIHLEFDLTKPFYGTVEIKLDQNEKHIIIGDQQ